MKLLIVFYFALACSFVAAKSDSEHKQLPSRSERAATMRRIAPQLADEWKAAQWDVAYTGFLTHMASSAKGVAWEDLELHRTMNERGASGIRLSALAAQQAFSTLKLIKKLAKNLDDVAVRKMGKLVLRKSALDDMVRISIITKCVQWVNKLAQSGDRATIPSRYVLMAEASPLLSKISALNLQDEGSNARETLEQTLKSHIFRKAVFFDWSVTGSEDFWFGLPSVVIDQRRSHLKPLPASEALVWDIESTKIHSYLKKEKLQPILIPTNASLQMFLN
eukprot:Blabericola_migrator_1__10717@NODE_612_length_7289_cov_45_683606_g445_i0_p4_GENE_NODE_612_length_7289_cov_45_683606_g445_i0NODE_612_length_7289_cov_45_683606_g445_i0_p4_ORF_typecomplete_len278_score47_27_NODE_612_length_7289_cov_45_683606_g445_i063667199